MADRIIRLKKLIEVEVEETIEDEGSEDVWHTYQLLSVSIDNIPINLEECDCSDHFSRGAYSIELMSKPNFNLTIESNCNAA